MQREIIEAAAKWWREKIGGECKHDNGADDFTNIMAMVFADMLADKNKPTEDQLDKFEQVLIHNIENELYVDSWVISCDYHPGALLAAAADEAGINHSVFPFKTSSGFSDDGKTFWVCEGYGASRIDIAHVD